MKKTAKRVIIFNHYYLSLHSEIKVKLCHIDMIIIIIVILNNNKKTLLI